MTVTDAKPRRKTTARAAKRRLRLPCTLNTAASERFRALPLKERERILEEFRAACAPAFPSADAYIAEKRREQARDHDA